MNEAAKFIYNCYAVGEFGQYPCGCVFQRTERGYDHFCNPSCEFDSKKVGLSLGGGYTYKGFENSPIAEPNMQHLAPPEVCAGVASPDEAGATEKPYSPSGSAANR